MDYGFQLPDEVFAWPPDEQQERLRGLERVFVLDESRGFVRTLLPVRLDLGSVQFGIWLEVPPEQAHAAIEVWNEPAYTSLVFEGAVANSLPPWGNDLLGSRATASPTSDDSLPVVNDGEDIVRSLLVDPWPRADLIAALPGLGHAH